MKHLILFLTISVLGGLFCPSIVCSQNLENQVKGITISGDKDTLPKNQIYKTWVSLNRNPFKVSGYLSEISDSSILVSSDIHGVLNLQINDIDTIRARKKYSMRNGALIGVLVGVLTGAAVGYSYGDDEDAFFSRTAELKAIGGAVLGILPGALIGGGLGSIKIVIPINGSMNNYNKYKHELKKRIGNSQE